MVDLYGKLIGKYTIQSHGILSLLWISPALNRLLGEANSKKWQGRSKARCKPLQTQAEQFLSTSKKLLLLGVCFIGPTNHTTTKMKVLFTPHIMDTHTQIIFSRIKQFTPIKKTQANSHQFIKPQSMVYLINLTCQHIPQ